MSPRSFTWDSHMSSKHYGKNGYGYNLRLSIISHWLCVSYPTRSGCRAKRSIQGPLTSHICFQDIPLLIWRPQSSSILKYVEVINTKHTELTFYLTKCNTLLRRMLYLPQARRPPALPVVELSSCPPASEPHTISISLDLNSFSNLKLVKGWQESIWKTQYQNINILVITLKLTYLGYS